MIPNPQRIKRSMTIKRLTLPEKRYSTPRRLPLPPPAFPVFSANRSRTASTVGTNSRANTSPKKRRAIFSVNSIKIFHPPDYRHVSHVVNIVIRKINEFSSLCFKCIHPTKNRERLVQIAKDLKVALPDKFVKDPDEFVKNPLNSIELKHAFLKCLYECLNKSNGVTKREKEGRYFMEPTKCKEIVLNVFKTRSWLKQTEDIKQADIVWTQWYNIKVDTEKQRVYNHIDGTEQFGYKKCLFQNIVEYYGKSDPFMVIPKTFYIEKGEDDPMLDYFHEYFIECDEAIRVAKNEGRNYGENVWILKPGESTNKGYGIKTFNNIRHIRAAVSKNESNSKTFIIQKYIERPLLIDGRKFDIRCFALLTSINGFVKGYFYKDGFLRTSAKQFTLKDLNDNVIHLTNETIQKKSPDFGRFEYGNKLSYGDLQEAINSQFKHVKASVYQHIVPQMKQLVRESFRAVYQKLNNNEDQDYHFEILGYDFIIDSEFHIFLIEANVNSCLSVRSPITSQIIPQMLDCSLRIAVDPLFPPAEDILSYTSIGTHELLPEIKYELVFDSVME